MLPMQKGDESSQEDDSSDEDDKAPAAVGAPSAVDPQQRSSTASHVPDSSKGLLDNLRESALQRRQATGSLAEATARLAAVGAVADAPGRLHDGISRGGGWKEHQHDHDHGMLQVLLIVLSFHKLLDS